jgi:hypothetical protein
VAQPDQIRRSMRFNHARLFSRCHNDVRKGKHVVVFSELDPATGEVENFDVLLFSTRLLRSDLFEMAVTADGQVTYLVGDGAFSLSPSGIP